MVEVAIIALLATGTGLAAYGAYEQGKSAQQQAKAEAAWQMYNAKLGQRQAAYLQAQAAREAESTKKLALFEVARQKREARQVLARQRALIGASGVTMEGSPLLTAEDTAAQLALEGANRIAQIETEGATRQAEFQQRIYGYKSQSILDISEASASRAAAVGYGKAGTIGAGASLLSGAGQIGYMGYSMRKKT